MCQCATKHKMVQHYHFWLFHIVFARKFLQEMWSLPLLESVNVHEIWINMRHQHYTLNIVITIFSIERWLIFIFISNPFIAFSYHSFRSRHMAQKSTCMEWNKERRAQRFDKQNRDKEKLIYVCTLYNCWRVLLYSTNKLFRTFNFTWSSVVSNSNVSSFP